MNKEEILKNSYICKINRSKLSNFLKENGFLPKIFISENTGKPIPPIERFFDKKSQRYALLVRCQRLNPARDELDKLYKSTIAYSALVSSYISSTLKYLNDSALIVVCDFSINELAVDRRSENLAENYYKFMCDEFGEKYQQDYNKHLKKDEEITK